MDLNSDLGEGFGPWSMGDDAAMLGVVTSANIACGGHASDPETMFATLRMAAERGVVVGAHPGYPDLLGFGRRTIPCTMDEITHFTATQIGALMGAAALVGHPVRYVKPHGMLGNNSAANRDIARAVVKAVKAVDPKLAYLAISGTESELAAREIGLETYSEIFADRGYTSSGQLVMRGQPGAMLTDPAAAANRLIEFLKTGEMPTVDGKTVKLAAQSICIHGDSDHAVSMAREVRARLEAAGIAIKPFLKS
jgi:UPF0271 protein